jgi:hypothetical protein
MCLFPTAYGMNCHICKMSEMQKVSEVFKSNFNYYQRVAHKKLSKKNVLLDFQVSLFLAGGLKFMYYSRNLLIELTKI